MNKLAHTLPAGSVMPKVMKLISISIKSGMSLSAASPSVQREKYGRTVPWDDEFLSGVRSALLACQIWYDGLNVVVVKEMLTLA